MTTLLTVRSPFSAPLRALAALVLLLGSLVIALPPLPAQAQSPDDGFNPGANEAVAALAVQPDGKILVGGNFTTLGGEPRQRLGRLNPGGSLDTTLVDPGINAQVLAIAVQPDGKILLGG
ncbi:MAG: delta-60 repeat domain-containing protein, partial [Anaerolineae bacterium]|nr:delta-60 repeat domain-containing protein [Anaerolineae bacterium]